MIARRAGIALSWFVLAAGCQKTPPRQCAEFDQAQAMLDEVSNVTLDPSFGDPRYEPVMRAFEAIPADCAQRQTAVTIAETIRNAMAERRSAPPPAPPAIAPASPSGQTEGQIANDVADYFDETDFATAPDGTPMEEHMKKLAAEAEKNGDFSNLIAELDRLESGTRSVTPPATCDEYHRLTLAYLSDTKETMQTIQDAIAQKDAEAMKAAAMRRTELKAMESKLLQMRRSLEQRYGVAR